MRRVTRFRRGAPALAMVVFLIGACAATPDESPTGSAAPAPSSTAAPSLTPTPSPSPTPLDAEQELLAILHAPDFSARVAIHGTETIPSGMWGVGASGSPVPLGSTAPTVLTYDGQAAIAGTAHLVRLQVEDAPNVVIWEYRRDSTTWRRTWLHPWQEMPSYGDIAGARLSDLLTAVSDLDAAGTGPDAEGLLHYVVPETPLSLITIWLQEEARLEPDTGTIEILAQPDGTPVKVMLHLESDDLSYAEVLPDGVLFPPREYDFEYTLSGVGEPVTLPALAPATTTYASADARLALEVPAGWEEQTAGPWDGGGGGADVAGARPSDGGYVQLRLMRFPPAVKRVDDATFQGFAQWVLEDLDAQGMRLLTVEATSVAGQDAYVMTLVAGEDESLTYLHQEAVLTDGRWLYAIAYNSPADPELLARYEFDQLLVGVQLGS
jgi:hypothetical protein